MSSPPDILLIAPGHRRPQVGAIINLPMGLLSLAAWLRRKDGFKGRIRLIDMNITDLRPEDFRHAKIIGLSAMTGIQIKQALQAARVARVANPKATLVWGGIHPSLLPEQTLRHPLVDVVVQGEGEETFAELVQRLLDGEPLEGLAGIWFKRLDGTLVRGPDRPYMDIEQLPLPAYDLIRMADYHNIQQQFNYQSSRGCPFRCGFCYNIAFNGRRWRCKSAEKVIRELTYLAKTYAVKNFIIDDDEFFIDLKRAETIIAHLADHACGFTFTVSCRFDLLKKVSDDFLKTIRKSGIRQIYLGAESGSPKILKSILKDIKREDIAVGARRLGEAGIQAVVSFMSGFPDEEDEDFEQTLACIDDVLGSHPLAVVNGVFPFNPYPGTHLYQHAVTHGFQPPDTLEAWGEWVFQYRPNLPWLDTRKRDRMEAVFLLMRFRYYLARLKTLHGPGLKLALIQLALCPWTAAVSLRWRNRWFRGCWELKLFFRLTERMLGYV